MLFFGEINRVAFKVFGLPIYWYSILICTGIILAVYLSIKEAKRVGMQADDVYDFLFWALPMAIIGARLYYVLLNPSEYIADPLQIINTRAGGLAIYGGLIAGGITMYFFCKKRYLSIWTFLDIAAPSVMIAQAIGRWGNFMNHEAYGEVTTFTFLKGLHLPDFIVDNMYIDGAYRQPTFLYESSWNVLGFIILLLLRRKSHLLKKGEVFLGYVLWYSFGRFFIEGMRTDSLMLGSLRFSQILSGVLFVAAIILIVIRRRNSKTEYYQRDLGGVSHEN